ncbi:TetR/AcrR family transcriptional regulator [Edaphobacter bradus]|uniref:TetR/AcrR family transcriptional regulator n=1 Tax=Edaphobacter bradus TaxID=2259016 RepID=UPI0021DF7908|nr:TetR/AcrR family transcriptional regulator [Edaphobacter bradus]
MKTQQRREKARQDIRQSILDEAREIITREGFAALTMRKLAERVDYSPASIYMHFRNRDQIAKEISRVSYADLLATLTAATTDAIATPAARFRALCHAYVSFGLKNPQTYSLIFMEDPAYLTAVFAEQSADDPATRSYTLLVEIAQDLIAAGFRANKATPIELAETIWAGLHGIVSLKLTCPAFPTSPAETLTSLMADTFLQGLATPTPAKKHNRPGIKPSA